MLNGWLISTVTAFASVVQCAIGFYGKETTGLRMMELVSNWPRRPFEQCDKSENTC